MTTKKRPVVVVAETARAIPDGREVICAQCVARSLGVKPGEPCPVCKSLATRYLYPEARP